MLHNNKCDYNLDAVQRLHCYHVHSCSKVMGFFFKHKKSDTYTFSIDLKNYQHKYEMFCDIYIPDFIKFRNPVTAQ